MSNYERYRELADDLLSQGHQEAADAIDLLLTNHVIASTSAHETGQQIAKQRSHIADLESQLQMVKGIRYQEMRLELPEGGHVSLRWPETMSGESAEMLRDAFDLQMKAHARNLANRAAIDAARKAEIERSGSAGDDA